MIRPIDTQTIYQQTQEISGRQQTHNQAEQIQQSHFSHIMQKETEIKKEQIHQLDKDEKVDNDLDKKREKDKNRGQKEKSKEEPGVKKNKKNIKQNKFDMRI
ncbi:hypothetical protein CS063_04205 [Sporanaerobium hydrogeniformans]|uniref:Uncharacterized protein n=1 Tax=Sporanaerobium hydrogeniformans TaxID=3072179 RepID=A0AC61DG27_9FIRM|nr:hypothetical protein [Sporanaerobium hydrogeniformans]PHV71768.1 hypothetical protein CS063_04205 [Sporanaerobium hydrogeniformans]